MRIPHCACRRPRVEANADGYVTCKGCGASAYLDADGHALPTSTRRRRI